MTEKRGEEVRYGVVDGRILGGAGDTYAAQNPEQCRTTRYG